MPRADRPVGRDDNRQRVARVKEEAAAGGLIELLDAVAADPEAGIWAGWAKQMQESGHADNTNSSHD